MARKPFEERALLVILSFVRPSCCAFRILHTYGAAAGLSYARKRDPQPTSRQGHKYAAPCLSDLHSDTADLQMEV